jgi:hypothetical protein
MDKEINYKSGQCQKCGKESNYLRVTIDTAVSDEPVEVCPKCYDEIETSNELFAKATLVGCGFVMLLVILVGIVGLIASVC